MIRILIVAPGVAVRAGIRALLNDEPLMQVVGEAANLDEMSHLQLDPDILIWAPGFYMDQESVRNELDKIIIQESSALLLVSNDQALIGKLSKLAVRAWGMLDPEASRTELLAGILALNEGLVVINPVWLKRSLLGYSLNEDTNPGLVEPLTERETEILQLLAYGLTNKQIAARLAISAHTVKFHVSSIFYKLGTTNRVEAVNLGLKKGLILL